jgi:acetyl-CoA synthetase
LVCLCVARPDIDRDKAVKILSTAVTAGLGGAFKPADVVFVPDLPRTRNMKLMRRVVRSAWLGEDAGDLSTLVNPDAVQAICAAQR